jgi:hypothetical protein
MQPRRAAIFLHKSAKDRDAAPQSLIRRFCAATLGPNLSLRFLSEGIVEFPKRLTEGYRKFAASAAA